MSAHYDRWYDTALYCLFSGDVLALCKCAACNMMREGGLEPPSLSAPDPKSRTTAPNDGPQSANAAPGSAGERVGAPGLRPIVRHGEFRR